METLANAARNSVYRVCARRAGRELTDLRSTGARAGNNSFELHRSLSSRLAPSEDVNVIVALVVKNHAAFRVWWLASLGEFSWMLL